MNNISGFNPNRATHPNKNIFGLPFSEENASLVIIPVPWEVTVSYTAGTARAADHILMASYQVDLFDADYPKAWENGYYMRPTNKKILFKSDYLRKEAELLIDYISQGEVVEQNSFMSKSLKEINAGGEFLNEWVYNQAISLIEQGKKIIILGGDHSTPLGYLKALSEVHDSFGILQIDAHCDLRTSYEGFIFSHASIMHNALKEIPAISKLVQVGIRDYCEEEWKYICNSNFKVVPYFDKHLKERQYEGQTWKQIVAEMIQHLPEKIYLSFDIDGLDRKYCPNTGTPVPGGLETEQVFYLIQKIKESGRQFIGMDLCEVGVAPNEWDANVGARVLWKLCNIFSS